MMYYNPALVVALNATFGGPNWTLGPQNTNILYNGAVVDLSVLKPDLFGADFTVSLAGSALQATIVQAILDKTSTITGFSKTGTSTAANVLETLVPSVPKVVGVLPPPLY